MVVNKKGTTVMLIMTFKLEKDIDELTDRVGNAVSMMEGVDIPSLQCIEFKLPGFENGPTTASFATGGVVEKPEALGVFIRNQNENRTKYLVRPDRKPIREGESVENLADGPYLTVQNRLIHVRGGRILTAAEVEAIELGHGPL